MLSAIRSFFETNILSPNSADDGQDAEHAVQLATAALFIELSRADFDSSSAERRLAAAAVRKLQGVSAAEAEKLLELAEEEASQSVSLYDFTELVHRHFAPERKLQVVEQLWRIAFADGRLSHHEEHMLRKIEGLLHIPHKDFIAAKKRARTAVLGDEAP